MADILYMLEGKVYLNITNQCPCACTFCIRNTARGVGSASTLWHAREPALEEIIAAIDSHDFTLYNAEVVFCGYGEPTCALDNLLKTCAYLKEKTGLALRLNTNGLSDLINRRPTAALLAGAVDTISISLNAPTALQYQAVTRSSFGIQSFAAMLAFAADARDAGANVVLTVVDTIGEQAIAQSRALADSLRIPLRVREYTPEYQAEELP